MHKLPIAVLGALLASPALAQRATGKSFDDLDIDRDGRISLAEAEKDVDLSRAFVTADRNKDGYLSSEEFRKLGQSLTPETGG